MDNPLSPEKQEAILEDALRTYPVLEMPRDITVDVMTRIQGVPAPRPFRPTWNDFLVGFVLTTCIGAIWFSLQNLPPLVIAHIRKESILLYQQILVNEHWILPVLSLSLAGFFAALTIPYLTRKLMK